MRSIERWYIQWPWRTPNPVFKVTAVLKSNISKTVHLGTMLLKNTNRKPYTSNDTTLNDLEWPLTPISSSRQFSTLNISDTTRDRATVTIERQSASHMRSIDRWYIQWPWRTPNPVFKVTAVLKSNISKTVHFRDNVTKEH